jgi:predicted ATPase
MGGIRRLVPNKILGFNENNGYLAFGKKNVERIAVFNEVELLNSRTN